MCESELWLWQAEAGWASLNGRLLAKKMLHILDESLEG